MGAAASTELTKDQLQDKYVDVKDKLSEEAQAEIESKFNECDNIAEILELVAKHMNGKDEEETPPAEEEEEAPMLIALRTRPGITRCAFSPRCVARDPGGRRLLVNRSQSATLPI